MTKHYTISQLAKCFQLSRSTLLYYDKKKLLKPSIRSANNYRYYNEDDFNTLKLICTLREVGINIKQIAQILKNQATTLTPILNQRLLALNEEIHQLRAHQRLIITLLGNKKLISQTRSLNKETWVALLRSAGLEEEGMTKWHQAFEQSAPAAHQDFLESLGLKEEEIKRIRQWSKDK